MRTVRSILTDVTPEPHPQSPMQRSFAMWTKPEFTEMRFGFEVTMYVYNR
jgi:coenzyme PQQ precursor peptide PqqA